MKNQRIILCDFDGVLHSYKSGWKGARNIPDPPVEGAIKWIENFIFLGCDVPDSISSIGGARGKYKFCIYSSRSCHWGGRKAMKEWLVMWGLDRRFLEVISFPLFKPPAYLTIDDRAICFQGIFPEWKEIENFKGWTQGAL